MTAARALNVVVAGTGFGRIYLDALTKGDPSFRLTGILARGGETSRALAQALGVPLHTRIDDVPPTTDIACVVVRSGATGGPGTELATQFLRRGMHVLQEHPVHHSDIAACMQAARQGDAAYAVNTLHPNLAPVRRFLAAAATLREAQAPQYIDVTCNSQMLYPLLDIAGHAIGGLRPWRFDEPVAVSTAHPFTTLHGHLHGIPLCLRVQNAVHPDDPDNHSLLLGQVSLGFDGGVLALPELHGPVLWHARLHAPRLPDGRLHMTGPGTERLAVASTTVLGPAADATWHDAFADTWPRAVLVALHDLAKAMNTPTLRRQRVAWALDVSQAWTDACQRLGMPALIRPDEPQAIPIEQLHAAVDAIPVTELRQP